MRQFITEILIMQTNNHKEVPSQRRFITEAFDHTIILSIRLYFVAVVKLRCVIEDIPTCFKFNSKIVFVKHIMLYCV